MLYKIYFNNKINITISFKNKGYKANPKIGKLNREMAVSLMQMITPGFGKIFAKLALTKK